MLLALCLLGVGGVQGDPGLVDHPIASSGARVYLDGVWGLRSPAVEHQLEATVPGDLITGIA